MTHPPKSLADTMTRHPAKDGMPAKIFELSNRSGMTATFMDIGATWLSCRVPVKGEPREVLLGNDTFEAFEQQTAYLGASVGRYANRIANGRFTVDGEQFQVDTNQGAHCLHGGSQGFNQARWQVESSSQSKIQFSLVSEHGDQGFPGEVVVLVTYELTDSNQVLIHFRAKCDKPTPVNLTNHAYFNLLGAESGEDCLGHVLSINANAYLPTDSEGIPVGELQSVHETSFDFLSPKVIGQDFLLDQAQQQANGYDHSFLLNEECRGGECAATVTSPDGLLTMKLYTTKPAVQLYTGNFLEGNPGRNQHEYDNYAGVALETQYLPDSPNHPQWPQPSAILQPEEEYYHSTIYQFLVAE